MTTENPPAAEPEFGVKLGDLQIGMRVRTAHGLVGVVKGLVVRGKQHPILGQGGDDFAWVLPEGSDNSIGVPLQALAIEETPGALSWRTAAAYTRTALDFLERGRHDDGAGSMGGALGNLAEALKYLGFAQRGIG